MKLNEACIEAKQMSNSLAQPVHVFSMDKEDEYSICMMSIAHDNKLGDVVCTFYPTEEACKSRSETIDWLRESKEKAEARIKKLDGELDEKQSELNLAYGRQRDLEKQLEFSKDIENQLRARIVELSEIHDNLPQLRENLRDALEHLAKLREDAEEIYNFLDKESIQLNIGTETAWVYEQLDVLMHLDNLSESEKKAAEFLRNID